MSNLLNSTKNKHRLKYKKEAITIAFILILSMTAILMTNPVVNAQTTTIPTHAFISVSPNPVGVNQSVFINVWLLEFDPLSNSGVSSLAARWQNYTILVTLPDKTTQTLGPYVATDASTVGITYVVTEVGNYTLTFNFPGQYINGLAPYSSRTINAFYQASNDTTTLTVQPTPLIPLPETPLPTGYWQTPIDWQNQLWYSISGNWFGLAQWNTPVTYNPDIIAPESAHILWAISLSGSLSFGGQIGGSMYSTTDQSNYYTGKSYEIFFKPGIIINGLFYNTPAGIAPNYGFYAVDLRTGKTIWYNNETANELPILQSASGLGNVPGQNYPGINYGEVFIHHNPNEVGGLAYLWGVSGTTYSLYDATTGNWILNVANSPGGTAVTGPNGELLVYTLNVAAGWLAMWNSTMCLGASAFAVNPWTYRPATGSTLQWSAGIQWNVSVPTYSATDQYTGVNLTAAIIAVNDGVVLASTQNTAVPQDYQMEAGYSAINGSFLWVQNRTVAPIGATAFGLMGPVSSGVYVEFNKATLQYYGFSITTGKQIWGPTTPLPNALNSYTNLYTATNNMLVANGLDGLYAYNLTNGQLLWSWAAPPAGLQEVYPDYPLEGTTPIAAGGLILVGSGVSHGDQLFRGAQLYAVNATTGQLVWSIDDFTAGASTGGYYGMTAADGSIVTFNAYDNQIYCIGKGQSATTVTTTPGVNTPNQVLISGTVTDQSPGTTCLGYPTAGTPAIADQYMSQWMEYLYQQQSEPMNATGVPVTLSYVDPNNNTFTIGQTTSDINGQYSYAFTPTVPGIYKIIATFGGSDSYYSSSGQTTMLFNQPEVETPTPSPVASNLATMSDLTIMIAAAAIAIIIAIAIVGLLILRKKP